MTSTLIDKHFLSRHPSRTNSNRQIAEKQAQVKRYSFAKRVLSLQLERHNDLTPDGLAAILVDDTLFAETKEIIKWEDTAQLSKDERRSWPWRWDRQADIYESRRAIVMRASSLEDWE